MRPCHGQGCWGLLLGLRGASIDDKRRSRHGISRRAASSRCWFPYGHDLDLWVRDLDRGKGEGRGIGDLHRGVRVDGDLLKVDRAARFHPRPPFSWGHAALAETIGWRRRGESTRSLRLRIEIVSRGAGRPVARSGPRPPRHRGRSSSGQLHPLATRTGELGPPLCPSCRWTRACLRACVRKRNGIKPNGIREGNRRP